MSYLVLARKWRPQTFTDLVGQEHVRRTLENAIAQDRVAHAFLFTGVRGVGKTTSARILAKALSCVNGPTASPCLACPACVEIAAGNDVDVQEIDGASYNGVDEVRRLQESLPYRPQRDRFKIFIVDEVHMLSQAAWNAFLKTLEEPPPHVKFIFATTEVHKVPVTILSRCQRYDFKTIAASTIGARLRYVLGEEKIEADDAAVSLIAREAAGSMRDAMSLLDQAIAWGGEKLVGEEVARVLGVASRSVLHRLAEALVAGRAEESLTIVSQLVENGYDLAHVARDLLLQLRDLVVARVCADPAPLLDMPQEERDMTVALAKTTSADDLVRLHQGFSRAFDEILKSGLPRAGLEMALVRLARRPAMVPVDELLGRLGELERRLGGGGGGAPRTGGPGGAGPSRAGGGGPSPSGGGGGGSGGGGPRPGPPAGRAQGQGPASGPFAMAAPSAPTNEGIPSSRGGAAIALAPPAFAPPAPRPSTVPPPRPMAVRRDPPPDFGPPPSRPAPSSNPRPSARPAMPTIIHDPSAPLPPPRPGVDMDTWKRVVQRVREGSISFASILELAAPLTVGAEGVVIGFSPGSFAAAQASEPKHTELLTRAARAELGDGANVSIELTPEADGALTLARINAAEQWERREAARKRVVGHPLVQAAMELLGAELQDVRLDDGLPRLQSRSLPGKG